jgi:hypothetical protein
VKRTGKVENRFGEEVEISLLLKLQVPKLTPVSDWEGRYGWQCRSGSIAVAFMGVSRDAFCWELGGLEPH